MASIPECFGQTCDPTPAGLVSWWKGEGNANDLVGGNNGTVVGSVSYATGEVGQGFSFSAAGSGVFLGNPISLQLQNFTIDAWIKRGSATQSTLDPGVGSAAIFGYGWGGYVIGIRDNGQFFLSDVGVDGVAASGLIADTLWHHVAATQDGTSVVLYVDGTPTQVGPYTSVFQFNTPVAIGAEGNNYGNTFLGQIDEVDVFNRALSGAEVAAIYAAGSAGKCPLPPPPVCDPAPSGLVSWWRGEGNASDLVGGNNGAIDGGVSFVGGEVGQAFSFSTNGQAVSVGNPANLQLQDFTIDAWIKRSNTNQASYDFNGGEIFGYGLGGYIIGLKDNGQFFLSDVGIIDVDSTNFITDTLWHHVAATKSGTAVVLYVDGISTPISAPFFQVFQFNTQAAIGARGDTQGNTFLGDIDEVDVFNRALSPTEVTAIYSAGSAGKCPPSPPPPDCDPTPAGLVSWWKGEGNANDLVGGNNGTVVGPVGYATGEVGQGFSFSAASSGVFLGNPANLQLQNFTVDAWIKRGSATQSTLDPGVGSAAIFGYGWGGYVIGIKDNGQFFLSDVGVNDVDTSILIADTLWHHVAATKDGTSVVLYVDGVPTQAVTYTSVFQFNTPVAIGAEGNNYGNTFLGQIDEVDVFNRGLSGAEVSAIYAAGSAGKCPLSPPPPACDPTPAGLVRWWKGDGNANDLVGGNNGTIVGGVTYAAGEVGQSFSFSTNGQAVSVGNPTNLQLQNFTIDVWIKRSNTNQASYGFNGGSIFIYGIAGYGLGLFDNGGIYLTQVGISSVSPTVQITDTNWHHLAVAKAGANVVFYVDGIAFLAPGYGAVFQFNTQAVIGTVGGTFANTFLGDIDEVDVFNRALSAVEVTAIYSAGSAGKCSNLTPPPNCDPTPTGLVSWWQGEGNANDPVGGNNGTIVGGVAYAAGEVGQSFSFSTDGQAVSVGNPAGLQLQDFTIDAWIKRFNTNQASYDFNGGEIFGYGLGGYIIGVKDTGQFFLSDVGISEADSTNLITDTLWHHVAATKAGTAVVLYVDDISTPISAPFTQVFQFNTPAAIGARGDTHGNTFLGDIDEVDVFNRALSGAEVAAIYAAGSTGKCPGGIAPSITTQPADATLVAGGSASLSVLAAGSEPFTYQWLFNSNSLSMATNSMLTLTNIQPANAGGYSVIVTNTYGSITSSVATLTVLPAPSLIQVVSSSSAFGTAVVPVNLIAQGEENALGFTIDFDPSLLTVAEVSLGSGAMGAALVTNTNQLALGRLGIAVSLAANTVFAAGTQQVVEITFSTSGVTNTTTASIAFGDQPVLRQVSDARAGVLASAFSGGSVTLPFLGYEGDVAPAPNGDNVVSITDWVQLGRFVAALDVITNAGEFQRADCAPRSTLGDGLITVADWVQAGRYAAGLDPLTLAGGPSQPVGGSPLPNTVAKERFAKDSASTNRTITIINTNAQPGQSCLLSVQLNSQGDENALGFSLDFDPKVLQFTGATVGAGAAGATLNVNTNQAAAGVAGLALALPIGTAFSAATQEVAKLNFTVLPTASGTTTVSFASQPVIKQIVDATAASLSAAYVNGTLAIVGPALSAVRANGKLTLSWAVSGTGFILESNPDLASPIWTPVVAATATNSTSLIVTVPVSGSEMFYRLRHP